MLYIDKDNNVYIKENSKYTKLKVEVLKDDINLIPTNEKKYDLENLELINYSDLKIMFLKKTIQKEKVIEEK